MMSMWSSANAQHAVKTLQAWAGKVMEEVIESSKQEQQQEAGAISKETGEGDLTRKGAAALRNYYPACRVYDRLLAGTGGCAFLTETRLCTLLTRVRRQLRS